MRDFVPWLWLLRASKSTSSFPCSSAARKAGKEYRSSTPARLCGLPELISPARHDHGCRIVEHRQAILAHEGFCAVVVAPSSVEIDEQLSLFKRGEEGRERVPFEHSRPVMRPAGADQPRAARPRLPYRR